MGALTNYLESGLLNHIFRGVQYVPPTGFFVGLTRSFVSGDIEAGTVDEPSTGGYARQAYGTGTVNWSTPYTSGSSTAISNNYTIEFPIATAAIGNVSGVFIADNAVSGNILFYGQLSSPRDIREGDQFVFPSGGIRIAFN